MSESKKSFEESMGRLEHSKMMLVSSGAPISQIADDLHFASSSPYSESFREVTGKTPQQYRVENQKYVHTGFPQKPAE